jgi:hypothetical protein
MIGAKLSALIYGAVQVELDGLSFFLGHPQVKKKDRNILTYLVNQRQYENVARSRKKFRISKFRQFGGPWRQFP